jgi:hypothetical protein
VPVSSASLLALKGNPDYIRENTEKSNGVNKGLSEPYADTKLLLALPVDIAAN